MKRFTFNFIILFLVHIFCKPISGLDTPSLPLSVSLSLPLSVSLSLPLSVSPSLPLSLTLSFPNKFLPKA